MRIRRRARISETDVDTTSSGKVGSCGLLQTYVCQLNQSPWDVMSFSPPSSTASLPPPPVSSQVNGADAAAGNGASERPISVPESKEIQSNGNMKETPAAAAAAAAAANKKKKVKEEQCCKTDGKSWRCRREAAAGSSLCDHHLSLIKNYQNLAHKQKAAAPPEKTAAAASSAATRQSTRTKPPYSPQNSYEFYYYSGFRPGWSKKIRPQITSKNDESGANSELDDDQVAQNEHHELDSEDNYVPEGNKNGGNLSSKSTTTATKKKRVRKPIKERSLASLM
ncbi:uncharacterized protein LOC127258964 [Andrographis paniculata]|uniref:uncharacterized protein LOC127258964 n=1 Tax=Andrographis paniculata TaxID=175694 RepID=UPI0021E8C11E|nr:uncharacterized protein LOC127258964 [Andrographis paniculata]